MIRPDDGVVSPYRYDTPDLFVEVRQRVRPVDLGVLVAVPLSLVVVFALPRSVKLTLALAYTRPTVPAAFASHFVHVGVAHLLANLLGYVVLVPFAYAFSLLSGRRTHFYVTFVTFLLAYPFVFSGLNVALVRPRIGFGSSGLVMAFLGFLPLTLLWYLESRFSTAFDVHHAPLFFFLGTGLIAAWGPPPTAASTAVAALAVLGGACYLWRLRADLYPSEPTRWWTRVGYAEFAVAGVLLSLLLPLAAFPPTSAEGGTTLNLYVHLLGYSFGFIVPYVTFHVVDVNSAGV